jgi:hypothetical protein
MALWTPDRLVSPPTAWLEFDAIAALVDNDPISTCTDSSGNGRSATSALTARPLFKTNIQNGLAVARFDGSNDFMNWGNDLGISAQPFTLFGAFDQNAASDRIFNAKSDSCWWEATATQWRIAAVTGRDYQALDTNWGVHVVVFNGASSSGSHNGQNDTLSTPGTGAPTAGAMIGSNWNSGTPNANFFTGDMGELGIIAGAVSTEERQLLEGYLGHKWGVTLASGHPYENDAPTYATATKTGLRFCIGFGLRQRTLR